MIIIQFYIVLMLYHVAGGGTAAYDGDVGVYVDAVDDGDRHVYQMIMSRILVSTKPLYFPNETSHTTTERHSPLQLVSSEVMPLVIQLGMPLVMLLVMLRVVVVAPWVAPWVIP